MKTNLKIFFGLSIFAIIATTNTSHAATTSVVNNKTSQFNDVLSEMGASTTDSSNAALAETIRRQRALLDAAGDTATTGGTNITTANACDAALRKCMSEKCGADFTKCASDSTTVWGNKMDACRRNTKCTGHEYTLLAPEILADRDAAIELSYYNSVVNCGNRYNNCVFGICGKSLENCLSKSAGDSAIAKCKSIADECREQDNGLAARVMGVFGDRRNIAATEAQRDEKRLYELRDLMRTQCTRFGAMFDERTLDCVYTVNFFAGTDNTLMASKKLYSGDTFQCTPDWFGVDITTYMENAQRLTRSQTSASAAAMGAGLGTAASLWTSGAVMRGINTQNAEKQAKEKCTAVGGEWVSAGFNQGNKCDMRKPKANCESNGYTWDDEKGCLDKNGQPITSSTEEGSNPIITEQATLSNLCKQYTKEQCDEASGCEYNNDQCVTRVDIQKSNLKCQARTKIDCEANGECKLLNGQCISVSDTISTDPTQTVANITCNRKSKENCSGSCVWDDTANNGKDKCVAKTDSSTGGGSNQGQNAPKASNTNTNQTPNSEETADKTTDQSSSVESKSGEKPKTSETNGRVVGKACIDEDIQRLKSYGWVSGTYIRVSEKANSTTVLKARCETQNGAEDDVPCNCKATACDGNNGYDVNPNNNGLCVKKEPEKKEVKKEAPIVLNAQIDGQTYSWNEIDDVGVIPRWTVNFPDYEVSGSAVCSETPGFYAKASNSEQTEQGGVNCWCKMEKPFTSKWVFFQKLRSGSSCRSHCAGYCAHRVFLFKDFRSAVFSSVKY